jgi:hypothetical protein
MEDPVTLIQIVKDSVFTNIDHALAYMAITILLAFYGKSTIHFMVRKFPGNKVHKFIIFLILILFGANIFLIFLTNAVLSISNMWAKYGVITFLILWGFVKFDNEVSRKDKK